MSVASSSATGGGRDSFTPSDAMAVASSHMPKRRPRPMLSCIECRKKKLKCDRRLPCSQCARAGKIAQCFYQSRNFSQPQPRPHVSDGSESDFGPYRKKVSGVQQVLPLAPRDSASNQISAPLIGYFEKHGVLEELQSRVEKLERILSVHPQSHTHEASQGCSGPSQVCSIFFFCIFIFCLHGTFSQSCATLYLSVGVQMIPLMSILTI